MTTPTAEEFANGILELCEVSLSFVGVRNTDPKNPKTDIDKPITDIGFDSFSSVELAMEIEDRWRITLTDDWPEDVTFRQLGEIVRQKVEERVAREARS